MYSTDQIACVVGYISYRLKRQPESAQLGCFCRQSKKRIRLCFSLARLSLLVLMSCVAGHVPAEDVFQQHHKLLVDALMAHNVTRVKQLLKTPYIDVNQETKPYLLLAINRQSEDDTYAMMSALLDAGANPNIVHAQMPRHPPLIEVVDLMMPTVVELLLARGAAASGYEPSPLAELAGQLTQPFGSFQARARIFELLIRNGASPSGVVWAYGKTGMTGWNYMHFLMRDFAAAPIHKGVFFDGLQANINNARKFICPPETSGCKEMSTTRTDAGHTPLHVFVLSASPGLVAPGVWETYTVPLLEVLLAPYPAGFGLDPLVRNELDHLSALGRSTMRYNELTKRCHRIWGELDVVVPPKGEARDLENSRARRRLHDQFFVTDKFLAAKLAVSDLVPNLRVIDENAPTIQEFPCQHLYYP